MNEIASALTHRPDPDKDRIFLIEKRICEKIDDYEFYGFSWEQDCALKTFFDLAQEFAEMDDFYRLCVMIPKTFYDMNSSIHILNESNVLTKVSSSEWLTERKQDETETVSLPLFEQATSQDNSYFIPIRGKLDNTEQLPLASQGNILGLFEIYPADKLTGYERFFFEKYTNRIGFQLHNKIIEKKNAEHLRFIKSLVNDIGHNVVVPNMYYKLFFRRLDGKINYIAIIDSAFREMLLDYDKNGRPIRVEELRQIERELAYTYEVLEDQFAQIKAHYENTSLFLETLLRQSHFEKGHYVLEKRNCNFKVQIIDPQLKRYLPRLKGKGIEVDDRLGGVPDEEVEAVVDVGLISQVYANLFSNAVKYTRAVEDREGKNRKFISYGQETLKDYFGEGRDGIKFNVFSTGPHIPPEEVPHVFQEGYRGSNVQGEYGTGHGLHFIAEVVALHNGLIGYEPTELGNNLYFILPK
jgi:signal transduction histidine kinase